MKTYDSYIDSGIEWIGEIPESWELKKLISLCILIRGNSNFGKDNLLSAGEYVALQYGKTYKVNKVDEDYQFYVNDEFYKESQIVRFGDVIFISTSETIEDLGHSIFYSRNEIGLLGGEQILLKPKTGILHPKYLYFSTKGFSKTLRKYASGVKVFRFNIDDLKTIHTPLPPYPEQTAIATYLDRKTAEIDELIADKKRLLELYEEEKTAIINQAVTKGINPDAPMKDSGIEWLGEIPEHWEVKKLKYVAQINPSKNPKYKHSTDEVVFLPMEKVGEDGSYLCDIKKPISELWNGFTYFERGDIIVAKITPCFENGKGAMLVDLDSEIGFGSTEFHVLRANCVTTEYLFYITRSELFMEFGEAFMTGAAGQKRVPTNFISEFEFGFPESFSEQQSIVRHIETECALIDAKKAKTEKLIELLTEYRTALISEVVTGKVKVIE